MPDPIVDTTIPNSDTIETPATVEVEMPDVEVAPPTETPNQLDAVFAKLEAMQKFIDDSTKKESQPSTPKIPKEQTDAYKTALIVEEQQLKIADMQKQLTASNEQRKADEQKILDDKKENEINALLDEFIEPELKSMIAASLTNKFSYDRSGHLWVTNPDGTINVNIATKASDYINVELRKLMPKAFKNKATGTSRDNNTFKHVSRSDVNTNLGDDIDINDTESLMKFRDDILAGKRKIVSKTQ